LGVAGYILGQDPTFNGRTPIWEDFSGLLVSNPIFGVGTTGVIDFVVENEGQPGFIPHTHAHSVLLDGATRYGLIFAALTLAIYALALISSVKALPENGAAPMALTVFVIVSGSAETIYSWNYWSIYLAVLTYVVLVSAAAKREVPSPEKDVRSPADT
jgi:O-antigen ligase